MMKFNADAIVKALKCCNVPSGRACSECPYHEVGEECRTKKNKDAASLIEEMSKAHNDLEYILMGVMHFVDKWLDGDELDMDEVNRSLRMREKTLEIVEDLTKENKKLNERLDREAKCQYDLATKIVDLRDDAKYIKADTVRKMQERLKECFYSDSENIRNTDVYIRDVIDQTAKEMLEESNV
jgi:hypothetical protein